LGPGGAVGAINSVILGDSGAGHFVMCANEGGGGPIDRGFDGFGNKPK
jgi:hypothetical protein